MPAGQVDMCIETPTCALGYTVGNAENHENLRRMDGKKWRAKSARPV
jgi:hypothetical protein